MKKAVVLLLVIVSLVLAGCSKSGEKTVAKGALKPAKKNPVIVVVDLKRVTMESDAGKKRLAAIKQWAQTRQQEIRSKVAEYNASEAMGKTSKSKLQRMKAEIDRLSQESSQEFDKRRMQSGDEMTKLFDPLINKLAKQNGWDVVLNKVGQVDLWSSDALDETDYVIAQLNASCAKPAATAPSAKPGAGDKGAAK